jgi:hypothetical protein
LRTIRAVPIQFAHFWSVENSGERIFRQGKYNRKPAKSQ